MRRTGGRDPRHELCGMRRLHEVREAVRSWREAKCAEACPRCPINCCEGRLNPRLDSLAAFGDLSVARGPADARPLEVPYVADRRVLLWGHRYLVGRCPHLDCGRCKIYDDANRPRECNEYPLHVQSVWGGLGGHVIGAELSCWILQQPENRDEVRVLAQDLGVDCVFHE